MKIVHVLGSMDFGGVESTALRLIHGLRGRGHANVVLDMSEQAGPRRADFRSIAEVVHVPYVSPQRLRFIGQAKRRFESLRPDAVLAYNFGNHLLAAIAARRAGRPRFVVRVAGSPSIDNRTRFRSLVAAHLARPVCGFEVGVSEAVCEELTRKLFLPRSRVKRIYNGVDVTQLFGGAEEARTSTEPLQRRRVLMVARMDGAKDQDSVIRAIGILRDRRCPFPLTLVGDGPRRADLESLVRDEDLTSLVTFAGARGDVPNLLGTHDLFVLSTRTEGTATALLEAMAARTPVIGSDIPPVREILRDGRCGTLVRPQDPTALADAIARSIEGSSEREDMVEEAWRIIHDEHSIGAFVSRWESILTEGRP